MAVPTYATDLTLIDDAQAVGNFVATGGGGASLGDETDYFINDTQCVSKSGFTATQKGLMADDVSAPTIAAGDAVFIWGRQANRNILDTVALQGGSVIMGTSNTVFAGFNVDGNDVEGSELLSWVNYAVDPTQTSSYTSGSPGAASTWDHFGMEWKILGSGALKGSPNAVGVIRHGRELTIIDGQAAAYGTFVGAATFDSDITRRWGILTPVAGGYQFHGAFVMGTGATAVDFRDSNRNIVVLEDAFVPVGFNEFEVRNASSNVEWTGISIQHLGTTSPSTLTLDIGTFLGSLCRFDGCGTTIFNSSGACTGSTWANSGLITLAGADISGSQFLTPTVVADEGAVFDDRTTSGTTSIVELANTTFTQGTNAHHAIRFGANVTHDITLTGIDFTDFSAVADAAGATLRFDATSGSINVNLIDCTVAGAAATTSNVGVDDAAGISVTLVIDPVATTVTVVDEAGDPVENARVLLETGDGDNGGSFPYLESITTLTQIAGVATLTAAAVHGLATNDYVVIRGATQAGYNKVVQITVTSTTVFTYAVDSGTVSPATGAPVFSYAPIGGVLTNASGVVTSSKTWGAAQSITGWARKNGTVSPFFKDANITIADGSSGASVTATLLSDE